MSERLYVDVESDVTICVERWPAARPDAPTIIAIHGFSSNRLAFGGLSAALDCDVEVLAVDCRGRGRSSAPTDSARYGMRRHADDVAAVLRHLGRRDVIVVGTSMGAWIATQLAAHHADLVRSAVLVDGGFFSRLPNGTDVVAWADGVLLGALGRLDLVLPDVDTVLAAMRVDPALAPVWNPVVEASVREHFEVTEGGVRGRLRPIAAEADARSYHDPVEDPYLRRDIAAIACPVHLITATAGLPIDAHRASSPIMPGDAVDELRNMLPQLTIERIEGADHLTVCLGAGSDEIISAAVVHAVGSGPRTSSESVPRRTRTEGHNAPQTR